VIFVFKKPDLERILGISLEFTAFDKRIPAFRNYFIFVIASPL